MDIKPYFFGLSNEDRKIFADKCGATVGHIRNVCYGDRKATTVLAAQFELHSNGMVTVDETLPTHQWHRVKDKAWPHAKGRPLSDVAAEPKLEPAKEGA